MRGHTGPVDEVVLDDGVVMLRPVRRTDVDALVEAIRGDPALPRWTRIPSPYTRRDAEQYVAGAAVWWRDGTDAAFVVADFATGRLIGGCGLHRIAAAQRPRSSFVPDEVGYWVLASERGRGVATRALRLMSRWGLFDLARPQLRLHVRGGNETSRRVAERVGYRYQGLVRAAEVDDDVYDCHRYVLTPEDLVAVEG